MSKTSYDSPLGGVYTPLSDKDSMQVKELMETCTNFLQRVLDLETTKTSQAKEITSLKKRVKKLEQRGRLRTPGLKGCTRNIPEIDANVDISLVHEDAGIHVKFNDEDMFDTSVFNDEEVFAGQDMAYQEVNVVEKEVSATNQVTTDKVVTTANVDISTVKIKSAKPKARGVVMQEPNYEMDSILLAEEQASSTDEEKARLFVQLLDARKKHFTALRAQEIRNKPPTQKQRRTTMCNYLKNMARYKHNLLRHKGFDDTHKLFNKALKRTNIFVPIDTEKVEGSKAKVTGSETRVKESSKRAGEELDRKSIKKQKVEDETKQVELKECFKMIPFDEDAVNTIPLATKQAPIVDYKITIDKRKIYYHITRADESTQVYIRFEDMLKMFNREDLEVLYQIVKDRKFKEIFQVITTARVKVTTVRIRQKGEERCHVEADHALAWIKVFWVVSHGCLTLEKEVPDVNTFTYERMDWSNRSSLLARSSSETLDEPPKDHGFTVAGYPIRIGGVVVPNQITVIELFLATILVLLEVLVFSTERDEGKHYNRIAYTNKESPPKEVWREYWHQCDGKRYKNDKKEGPVDEITVKVLFFMICA
nr:hypothetical protein [Tanacetum cinerariifolium]